MTLTETSIAAHPLLAGFQGECRDCLAAFTQDAECSLAALYFGVREIFGERAALSAASDWLRTLEERLDSPRDLPELASITVEAIAVFASTVANPTAGDRAESSRGFFVIPKLKGSTGEKRRLTVGVRR
jgi:hypothetical protein